MRHDGRQAARCRWRKLETFLHLKTRWMSFIGTRWRDAEGHEREYWCTHGADSVIVLPIRGDELLLPAPMFRPGVERCTLDFPGGRLEKGAPPEATARAILRRELGVDEKAILDLSPLTDRPLLVNSSTSDQRLFGFVATLRRDARRRTRPHLRRFTLDEAGMAALLRKLECLQCRALLLEYLWRRGKAAARHDTT